MHVVLCVVVLHWLEIRVLHRVARGHSLGVVVAEHLAQQIQGFLGNELVVLSGDELLPGLAGLLADDVVVVAVQCHVVLLNVREQVVCAQNLRDLDKLIVVVLTLKEWLLLEDHSCEHASKGPNVKRVVIDLEVDQKLGSLEVPGGDAHIVLLAWMVEFRETPVDESQLAVRVVNHDVVRLHIAVHDALAVAEVEGLEDFEHVVPDVEIGELFVQSSEVHIPSVNVLHD